MQEQWKSIPGFSGYEASDAGRIRPAKGRYGKTAELERFLAELVGDLHQARGEVLQPWVVERHGRKAAYVTLYPGGKQLVHRLVCLAFHGLPTEEQNDCCHKDHNSLNNRADNLRWDTHANNIQESYDRQEELARWEEAAGFAYTRARPIQADVPF